MKKARKYEALGGNTGFASGGVACKLGALCFVSSVVLVDSFVLRNPPERKAQKRWPRYLPTLGILTNGKATLRTLKRRPKHKQKVKNFATEPMTISGLKNVIWTTKI